MKEITKMPGDVLIYLQKTEDSMMKLKVEIESLKISKPEDQSRGQKIELELKILDVICDGGQDSYVGEIFIACGYGKDKSRPWRVRNVEETT